MVKANFIKLFETSFKDNWDLLAMTDYITKKDYKYKDVAEEVERMHILFERLHVEKNDKIALVGRNTPMWATSFISIVTYGAVVVPILQDFHANDIQHIINHSDAKYVLMSDNIWEEIDERKVSGVSGILSITSNKCLYQSEGEDINGILEHIPTLFDKKYPNGFSKEDVKYIEKDNSEIVEINYTSGSTGLSKGVMISGQNLAGNVEYTMQFKDLAWHKKVVTFLPLAHCYGCAFDFLLQICTGSHITFLNKVPSPKIILQAFAEVKPDLVISVPLVIEKIYKNLISMALPKVQPQLDLGNPQITAKVYAGLKAALMNAFGGNIKEVVIGGASFNITIQNFLKKIDFPFTVGYGMTECAPLISYSPHESFIVGSVGKLLPCMQLKIKDSEDPENIPGEILVKGDHVMLGYYENPEATAAALDKDGWLHTGDMGTIDKNNNIFIKGRCKDMILGPSGQNIYPETIEEKLVEMPYVFECLVTTKDEKLVALVYPDKALMEENGITKEQLEEIMEENRKNLNTQVASYEGIKKIIIFPTEFEKTPKKNIKRYLYENKDIY